MCRSIKTLRAPQAEATDEEIQAAALQFVRKVSGYRHPSRVNEPAFTAAVEEVAAATRQLLEALVPGARPPAQDLRPGHRSAASSDDHPLSSPSAT